MTYIIAALAVYKTVQIIDSLLPRDPAPWVKVLASALFSFGAVALTSTDEPYVLSALAVATLSGATHVIMRLLTYLGDMALRKSIR